MPYDLCSWCVAKLQQKNNNGKCYRADMVLIVYVENVQSTRYVPCHLAVPYRTIWQPLQYDLLAHSLFFAGKRFNIFP